MGPGQSVESCSEVREGQDSKGSVFRIWGLIRAPYEGSCRSVAGWVGGEPDFLTEAGPRGPKGPEGP